MAAQQNDPAHRRCVRVRYGAAHNTDSVDRNALTQIAELSNSEVYWTLYEDSTARNPDTQAFNWDERGVPHVATIAPDSLNLRIVNGFHYGVADDISEFKYAPDFHGPGLAEDRVTELFEPFVRTLGKIDMIQLHSGSPSAPLPSFADGTVWDLAFWGRTDSRKGISTLEPLRTEQIEHWLKRMRSLIDHVRATWPDTSLWLRTVRASIRSGVADQRRAIA